MAIAFRAASSVTTTSTATTIVASPPAGITTNDVMIAIVTGFNGAGSQTVAAPAGWTQIGSTVHDTTSGVAGAVFWKAAAAGESGNTYTFTFGTASDGNVIIGAYSGVSTTAPVNINSAGAAGTSTAAGHWTGVAVTTTVANCQVLQCAGTSNGTSYTMPSGWTQRSVSVNGNGEQNLLADEPLASAGTSGTPTWIESAASDRFMQWTVALAPSTGGTTQNVSTSGIASSQGFGQPTVILGAVVSPSGIASSQGIGKPTVILGSVIGATGIASSQGFGLPAITARASVSATGIASSQGFGQPAVILGTVITPSGIASSQGFGQPNVRNVNTIVPAGIGSSQGFGQPTVILGAVISPNGIASSQGFGLPGVILGAVVSPNGIASSQGLGLPGITSRATISPSGIASSQGFGLPGITSRATISPAGIGGSSAFGQPAITQGPVTVHPAGIPGSQGFGLASVTAGPVAIHAGGIASSQGFGQPAVTLGPVSIHATGIASSQGFGQPAVQPGPVALHPVGIGSSVGFGLPALASVATIRVNAIGSSEKWGQPSIATVATVHPAGIGSSQGFGLPAVSTVTGPQATTPHGIASSEAWGFPLIVQATVNGETGGKDSFRGHIARMRAQRRVIYTYKGHEYYSLAALRAEYAREAQQQEPVQNAPQATQAKAKRRVGKDTGLVFDAYQERHRQSAGHIAQPKDHVEELFNEMIRIQGDLDRALAGVEAHRQAGIRAQRDAEIGAILGVLWQQQLRSDDEEAFMVIMAATDDAFLTLLGN